jgi:hypothetical protein
VLSGVLWGGTKRPQRDVVGRTRSSDRPTISAQTLHLGAHFCLQCARLCGWLDHVHAGHACTNTSCMQQCSARSHEHTPLEPLTSTPVRATSQMTRLHVRSIQCAVASEVISCHQHELMSTGHKPEARRGLAEALPSQTTLLAPKHSADPDFLDFLSRDVRLGEGSASGHGRRAIPRCGAGEQPYAIADWHCSTGPARCYSLACPAY